MDTVYWEENCKPRTLEPTLLEQSSSAYGNDPAARPVILSVVIPVRDRWAELEDCLATLARQLSPPPFEVVIIDDGSRTAVPDTLAPDRFRFPLTVERRAATGISAARNAGFERAHGEIVMFIDSDCFADEGLLHAVREAADRFPADVGFQANLHGSDDTIVAAMEGLRLETIIDLKRTADGHVHYLNTSGFALRRSYTPAAGGVFDESVQRGEDSILLADLLELGTVPRLLDAGIVRHVPRLGLLRYVTKHFQIGYQTDLAQSRLARASQGRLDSAGRRKMFTAMLQRARGRRHGWSAFGLIIVSYAIERMGRMASRRKRAVR